MAHNSRIEWTETTWNPVVGCSKVSSGCANCYAERMANRLRAIALSAQGTQRNVGRAANYLGVVDDHGRWTGQIHMDESAVDAPLSWRSPRLVFVNSMSDLFHPQVTDAFIRSVFDTMNRSPQHTFQVLTKRPERAAEISNCLNWTPNIWMGTSVEDASVRHRIADLRRIRALTRFLSIEPMLGPIPRLPLSGIHWVIVGGESGPGARTVKSDWVRQIRDRCKERGVPFFFKQWGGVQKKKAGRLLDGRTWNQQPSMIG